MQTSSRSIIWIANALIVATVGGLHVLARPQQPAAAPAPLIAPIDPQVVRDQDDMTWDDYKPIPGTDWANTDRVGTVKTIRLALVFADFPDFDFVMTKPKHSDLYGNPQIDPVKREEIPQFYRDFYAKPGEFNRGHTVHEYWMEQSRGRIGVAVTAFGPYRMSKKQFQYGGLRPEDLPAGDATAGSLSEVEALWQADAGADIAKKFDLVARIFAGYDESGVWQEFGEMKFQTKNDITPEFGNPDPSKPRFVRTRYVDWTSWSAGSWLWSNAGGGVITTAETSGAIRHEVSHAAFRIGDNYNNPYVQPYRRVGAGPWDLMDRGSFNGPGGPHHRYPVPKTEGDVMAAGVMLRQKVQWNWVTPEQLIDVTRSQLEKIGVVVGKVTARAVDPADGFLSGVVVRLDGDAPSDRTPVDDPATNPLSSGNPNFNFYTMEVVQRIGYDSYTPDSGVLLAKNKEQASPVGGPNSFSVFNWVIDAHPEDMKKVDFKRPDGTPVMRTIADYRQLNDALFHAGLNSGSQYEWTDTPNRLQFYVIDVQHDSRGILSYTVGVRSLDGAGPQTRAVQLTAPPASPPVVVRAGEAVAVRFTLANTGKAAPSSQPTDVSKYAGSDIYRLSVSIDGQGWQAAIPNALAAVPFGQSQPVSVTVARAANGAGTATVKLTATSESDPTKTTTVTWTLR